MICILFPWMLAFTSWTCNVLFLPLTVFRAIPVLNKNCHCWILVAPAFVEASQNNFFFDFTGSLTCRTWKFPTGKKNTAQVLMVCQVLKIIESSRSRTERPYRGVVSFPAEVSSLFSLPSLLLVAQKQEHPWDSEAGKGPCIYALFCLERHIFVLARVEKVAGF